jgi:hypothetical protein
MAAKQWARIKGSGVHGLRRGAWYVVVGRGRSGMLVVNVSTRNVPVRREQVDVRDDQPVSWSVVQWDGAEPGAKRISESGFDLTYVVCPSCRGRTRLGNGQPAGLTCPECAGEFAIDWSARC